MGLLSARDDKRNIFEELPTFKYVTVPQYSILPSNQDFGLFVTDRR